MKQKTLSRNKLIKAYHKASGLSYKECRANLKAINWNIDNWIKQLDISGFLDNMCEAVARIGEALAEAATRAGEALAEVAIQVGEPIGKLADEINENVKNTINKLEV